MAARPAGKEVLKEMILYSALLLRQVVDTADKAVVQATPEAPEVLVAVEVRNQRAEQVTRRQFFRRRVITAVHQ